MYLSLSILLEMYISLFHVITTDQTLTAYSGDTFYDASTADSYSWRK